jgi:alginate O-acetyltransferase complex protein AlgI
MTVMVLGGLWHDAGWTFLIWGAIHGLVLGVERLTGRALDNSAVAATWWQVPRILLTFLVVCLAWVFFRAADVGAAATIIVRIATLAPGDMMWSATAGLVVAVPLLVISDVIERRAQVRAVEAPAAPARVSVISLRQPLRLGGLLGLALVALLITRGGEPVPFIYFQF